MAKSKVIKGRFRDKDYVRIKVVSMGDSQVGKSCLIKRHCEHKFVSKYIPTIGVDFGVRPVKMEERTMKVNFWDLSGNSVYFDIRNEFYKQAQGLLLVFDVTSRSTLTSLEKWVKEYKSFSHSGPVAGVVCGNKVDKRKRAVTQAEGEAWAKNHGFTYFETSAKSGMNVENAFVQLFDSIYRHVCPSDRRSKDR
ncbi:hypothetical protein AAMO2058_001443000 [Amorphochlora amoebiformis]